MDVGLPRGKATPWPHNALRARHLERRVSARQVRPGPSQFSFLNPLRVAQDWVRSLAPSRHGCDPRPRDYRPPEQEPSACLGGREPGGWSCGALEGWDCGDFFPFSLTGLWGRASGSCPLADLSWVWDCSGRGPRVRDSRCGLPAVGGIPWRPVARNTAIYLGYLGGPESLMWHFLFFKNRVGFELVAYFAFSRVLMSIEPRDLTSLAKEAS